MKRVLSFIVAAMFAGQAWAQTTFEIGNLMYTVTGNNTVSVGKGSTILTGDLKIPKQVKYGSGRIYTVTSIGTEAFLCCSGLTSVIIPESITSIGAGAFSGCSGLTSVIIPESITSIGYAAFHGCGSLTSIDIPNSVTYIGERAFLECSSLTNITIPNSITSISTNAFNGCSGLTSIEIPNSVTDIGAYAFEDCSSLTSVEIPNSVTSISDFVFYRCSGLTEVTIPESVTSIGDYAFYDCIGLKSVTIPNSVTSIGSFAFVGCSLSYNTYGNAEYLGNSENPYVALINSTTTDITSCNINENCKVISDEAFFCCGSLTSITIPKSVSSIGSNVFGSCGSLISVTIPNSVTSIGNFAFDDCYNATLYCECEETSKPSGWSSKWNAQTKWGCMVVSVDNRKVDRVTGEITGENYELIDDNGALWFLHDAIDPMVTITFMPDFGYHWGDGINNRIPRVITEPVTASKTYWSEETARICEEMVDAAVPATCTEAGRTAGKHCSVCNAVLEGLEVIPALGHTYSTTITAPTCTAVGYTTHTCSVCVYSYYSDTVDANGHKADSVEFENIIPATCTAAGSKDSVVFCSVCQVEVSREERTIPAIGHTEVTDAAVAATCTAAGKTEGKHCSVCNAVLVAQQDVDELGHTEVTDAAVAATCTAAGKTEGKHCSVCNAVLVAQQEVEALGHKFEKYTYNNDATTAADGTETAVCERGCGTTDTRVAEGTKLSEPEKGTAVTDAATSTLNIYTRNNVIVIENATEEISVYDAMGRLICRDAINRVRMEKRTEIRVTIPGLYIVKVGGAAKRVMVN